MAKKYGQTGEKNWLTSAQYQSAPSMDKDTREYIRVLNSAALNATTNLEMTTSNMIIQVLDRKGFTDKYTAAVIKKSIDFSKDTYSAAFNKFSQFVSENQTIEAMEKNAAKYGYKVQERQGVSNAEHNIAGIRSTREAMKWLFDAKKNAVSPLYECGNNDHLLVLALTEITPKGYISKSNAQVAQYLKSEVLKDNIALSKLEVLQISDRTVGEGLDE